MTDPNARRMGSCVGKSHAWIRAEMHRCYDNAHPDLTPWKVDRIHAYWTKLGKQAKAGRL